MICRSVRPTGAIMAMSLASYVLVRCFETECIGRPVDLENNKIKLKFTKMNGLFFKAEIKCEVRK